nr:hypothetical protein [Tanacetum cinerariifolium]
MGYSSAHVEDDSLVKEVVPVKAKKVLKCREKSVTTENKESSKKEKYVALCKAWCGVSKNNVRGSTMKTRGFWSAVIDYFEKEMGTQSEDTIPSSTNEKIRVAKKAKTSETISGSSHGGLLLNEEVDGYGKKVREVRPMS